MNNFDHATEAVTTAQNSAGSAAKENARYMESLDAKVSKLKSTFQQLATSVIDSGLVKGILDLATGFLNLANTPIGTFVTQATLLGGVLWGGAGLIKAANILPNLFGGIVSGAGALSNVGGVLNGVLGLSAGKFFLIAAAIAAVVAIIPQIVDNFKRLTDRGYEAERSLVEYNEELATNKTRLEELEKIPEYRRTDEINDEIEALRNRNKELETGIKLKQQEAIDANFEKKYGEDRELKGFNIKYTIDEYSQAFAFLKEAGNNERIFVENAKDALAALVTTGTVSAETVGGAWIKSGGDAEKALESLGYSLQESVKEVSQEEYFTGLVKEIEDMNTAFFANKGVVDQDFINRYGELSQELKTLKQDMEGVSETEIDSWMEQVASKYGDLIDAMPELQDAFYNVNDSILELNEGIPITVGQYEQLERYSKDLADMLVESGDGYIVAADKMHDFGVAIGDTNTSIEDLNNGLSISDDRYNILINTFPQLRDLLVKSGDEWRIMAGKEEEFREKSAGLNSVIGDVGGALGELGGSAEEAVSGVDNLSDANETTQTKANNAASALGGESGAVSGLASATEGASNRVITAQTRMSSVVTSESRARKTQLQSEMTLVENLIKKYNELKEARDGSGGLSEPKAAPRAMPRGVSFFASDEYLDDQTKVFKEQIEIMEHRLFLMEKEGKSEEERIVQIRAIQAEIEKQKQWYYDQGLDANSEYIRDLEKQWWGFEDDIKDLYKDQADVYETLFSAVSDKAKEEIKALKEKKDAIKAENDALEEQIQKQEALDALNKAKQNKVLVYKDGKMQYVSDVDAISQAQKDLEKIEREDAMNEQLEQIDKEIEKWEEISDKWGSIPKEYKKFQDLLMLEQKLGIKLEGENWEKRLGNLQDYVDKYNELMSKANVVGKVENAVVTPFIPKSSYGPKAENASSGIALMATNNAPMQAQKASRAMAYNFSGAQNIRPMSFSDMANKASQAINIAIDKFAPNLPNVSNGEDFAQYMKNNFWRETLHYVKA